MIEVTFIHISPQESSIVTCTLYLSWIDGGCIQLNVAYDFGQRGSNEFQKCDVQIIFGTPYPNPVEILRQAQALHWDKTTVFPHDLLETRAFETTPGSPAYHAAIRAFPINLGWVHSEGEQALQTGFHGMPENWAEEIGRRMPAGRMIVPDDVAGLMAYLVSPSAQMMTGAIIDYEQMPAGVFDAHPALAPE